MGRDREDERIAVRIRARKRELDVVVLVDVKCFGSATGGVLRSLLNEKSARTSTFALAVTSSSAA